MANTLKLKRSAESAKVPTTAQLQLGELAVNTYDGRLFTKKNVSGTESVVEFVSDSGTWGISINGNAATATTLQTGRTINGTSFNGSANITTASWGTARTLTIGNTGKSVDGSAAVSWSLAEIGALQNWYESRTLPIVVNDCVDIGTFNVSDGAIALRVSISVSDYAFSTTQIYDIAANYAASVGWAIVTPIAGNTSYSGNSIRLEAQESANSLLLRIRRTAGTTAGTAAISIANIAKAGTTFTASTAVTAAAPAVTAYFPGSGLQIDASTATWRGDALLTVAGGTLTGNITAPRLISNVAQGTAPLGVTSTTVCTNLNADLLDGLHESTIVHGAGTPSASRNAPVTWVGTEVTQYKSGFWDVYGASWMPTTDWWWGMTLAHASNSSSYLFGGQLAIRNNAGQDIYVRHLVGGADPVAGAWHRIWTSGSDGSGSGLDADLLDGYHVGTSGGTIPLLNAANTWSALQSISVGGNQLLLHPATSAPTVIFRNDGATFYLLLSDAGASPSGTWNALRPFAFNLTTGAVTIANGLTATLTGNASTATTLQTARNINGTSFNGSANITTATWGTARTLTIGNTGKSVDGSAAVSWSLSEIGALPAAGGTLTGALTIDMSASGTGLTLASCDLEVGGSILANYISADTVTLNYDPVQPSDATSKAYVDAMASKDACLVATFNPIPYGVFDSLTGTIAVTYTPFTFTSVSSNTITLTGHQFNTGDCIRLDPSVQDASNYLTVNGTARAPGNTANWYVIKVDANNIKVSNSSSNALADSSVSITITGTVTVTAKIPAVVDGGTLSVGSRVLVRSQTSGAANGIYEVAGNTINAWSMYRSPDADTWGALSGALVPVPGGTVNNDSLWICTNGSTGTINTTAVAFRALATANVTYGSPYSTEPSISTTGPVSASRFIRDQGAPATQNTAATLTSAQVGAGILQTTPTAPITLTLPTGTTMEEIVIGTGEAYDLSVINTSANAVTIAANTGHTIVGNATIAANTSSLWCFRKTGANTFVAYRIS